MSKKSILTLLALRALASVASAQTLKTLVHPPPGGANLGFQLTDGTVMFQADRSQDGGKLTPEISGSDRNGRRTKLGSLHAGYVPED